MRVLLVDNYDSYTFNLYQLLAGVVGAAPTVMVNDDPRLSALGRSGIAAYDCVVISPGPGRPQHMTDLGWCAELLEQWDDVPVLGVCLGHQAIAHHAGGEVVEGIPRHGHVTRVRHDGDGLFAGLPQDFTAVRYHSLHAAEPLPPPLRATAWAEDGTVMGLRHTVLPRWGVQFHPESVATEHGAELVANFRDLVAAHRQPAPVTVSAPSVPTVHSGVPEWDLAVVALDHAVDGARVFAELYAGSDHAFWLDSSAATGDARFSFLGDDSGPHAELLTYRVGAGAVTVADGTGEHSEPGSIFDVLARRLADRRIGAAAEQLPFDLTAGYVGYFGYEAKDDCGFPSGAADRRLAATPDAAWLFADRLIAIDHAADRTYLVAVSPQGTQGRGQARAWAQRTAERIADLLPEPSEPAPDGGAAAAGTFARDEDRYLADIGDCLAELRRGESYEICLTNQVHLPPLADPFAGYLALRRLNPAPYAAYLRLGEVTVLGSSPERFLRIRRDRTVESRPIKGTAPRDADPRRDGELRRALVTSPKTRAENLMIVDLVRNDLGKVCEVGSVAVPDYLVTESYATVHQLVSTIRGRLRPDVGPMDCVRACFPGGSMTGAPKLRTMEIIDRLEGAARGVYSGALGYFGLSGGADLSIVIRTAVATADGVTVGTGGAIVADSDPAQEYAEIVVKADALRRALGRVSNSQLGCGGLRPTLAALESRPDTTPVSGRNSALPAWP